MNSVLFLIALFGGCLFLSRWRKRYEEPHIRFSAVAPVLKQVQSIKTRGADLPVWLFYAALTFLVLAWLDPHYYVERHPIQRGGAPADIPVEGIALYLVLDQSGSMRQEIPVLHSSGLFREPKIDFMKKVAIDFVKQRPQDMIGLIAFARGAEILSPLTPDHSLLLEELTKLNVVQRPEEDGTAIGYAIYKATHLIAATRHYLQNKPPYLLKGTAIVLVTDGFQDPNLLDRANPLRSLDISEASDFAKENGVKLYLINIEPAMAQERYRPHRSVMREAAEKTGGQFYLLSDLGDLPQVFASIDRLEKSVIPQRAAISKEDQPERYRRISLFWWLMVLGTISFGIAVMMEGTWLRRMP